MNTTKSKSFTQYVATTMAAAGILCGGALGFAAAANASTATAAQTTQEHATEYSDTHQPGDVGQRKVTPAARRAEPKPPPVPGEHPAHERPARNA